MDNRTTALNILDVNRDIEKKQLELEALHEMREHLITELALKNPDNCV